MSEHVWTAEHGMALRDRRTQRGLSQEALAELAGVTARTVSSLEHGKRPPRPSTIQLLAEALDCRTEDLLLNDRRGKVTRLFAASARLGDRSATIGTPLPGEDSEAPDLIVMPGGVEQAGTRRRVRIAIGAGLVAVAVVTAAVMVYVARNRTLPSDTLDPDLVAVAIFENKTGDPALDGVGQQVSDWIAEELTASGLARAVGFNGGASETENRLAPRGRLHELARASGAGVVVSGFYNTIGDSLHFQAWIDDACKNVPIYAVPAIMTARTTPTDVVEHLGDRVLGALAAHYDYLTAPPSLVRPPSFAAYREFRAGLDCWRDGITGAGSWNDLLKDIRHHFQRAVELDPTWLHGRNAIVFLHYNMGNYAAADSCLKQIARDRDQLSPYGALIVEQWNAVLQGNPHAWLRALRSSERLAPERQWWKYMIGAAAGRLNRYRESLEALDEIDPALLRDPLIGRNALLIRAEAYHGLGQYERELETVRLLEEYYPGDKWTWGRNRFRVFAALGRVDEIHRAIDEYLTLPRGGLQHPGYHMEYAVIALRVRGYRKDAARIAERAVAFYLDRPPEEARTTTHRWQLADCLYVAERWDEAQVLYEELATEFSDELWFKGRLGTLAARRGDRETAMRTFDELRRLDRRYLFGTHTTWCASIAAQLGERERAVELLREAKGQGAEHHFSGLYLHPCFDLEPLYGYPPYEELRRPRG